VLASVQPLIVDRLMPQGAAPELPPWRTSSGGLLRNFGIGH
jgi:hypothetical protein